MEASNVSSDLYGSPMDAVAKRRLAAAATESSYTGLPLGLREAVRGYSAYEVLELQRSFHNAPVHRGR